MLMLMLLGGCCVNGRPKGALNVLYRLNRRTASYSEKIEVGGTWVAKKVNSFQWALKREIEVHDIFLFFI